MRRTPYSPFVLKETAPDPWKAGRVGVVDGAGRIRGVASISE
jgi:hypothetical protein